jgi:antitoxin component of MazEF toxin-antitoxin module
MTTDVIDRGGTLGIQVTSDARAADLVEIDRDDDGTVTVDAEPVWVGATGGVALVAGIDAVGAQDYLALLQTVASDRASDTLSDVKRVRITQNGGGVALPLPDSVAAELDVEEGDPVAVQPAPGLLVVTPGDAGLARLVDDLATIRREQVE